MQQCEDLKFVTALHVAAYSAISRCVEFREKCCAFRATVDGMTYKTGFELDDWIYCALYKYIHTVRYYR
jgi:hypothetical protein